MIAYITHDQVNSELALRIAGRLGLDVVVLPVKDSDQAIAADQLVLDLDHLPLDTRSKLFLRIGRGEIRSGITVHSYQLSASETRTLQAAGVRVARRMTAATLVPDRSVEVAV